MVVVVVGEREVRVDVSSDQSYRISLPQHGGWNILSSTALLSCHDATGDNSWRGRLGIKSVAVATLVYSLDTTNVIHATLLVQREHQ